MKSERIFIERLVQPCITRNRGKEAFNKMQEYLIAASVEIDFSNCEMVSLSFLDELIIQIHRNFKLSNVVFRVPNQLIEDRLARISGFRRVTIYSRINNKAIHEVTPQLPIPEKANFVSSKALL